MTGTQPGARLEALVVRLRAAGCVFAEEEAALLSSEATEAAVLDHGVLEDGVLEDWVRRRVEGEPLETIVGWVEFAGLRLRVAPGVFVPRRRSELLVREAVAAAPPGGVLVELCCGVAAIAAAVAQQRPDLEVVAAEIDEVAVGCARANLAAGSVFGAVFAGDLYDALPEELRGRVDVLAANAPYVPTDQIPLMPREARDHEPTLALDGGRDGLDVHRRIAAAQREWLSPRGVVLIETSVAQAAATAAILRGGGTDGTAVVRDDELDATVVRGWLTSINSAD